MMMMEIQKVVDPARRATDPALLAHLERQGVDKDYVEFVGDYGKRVEGKSSPYAKFYRDLKSGERFMVVQQLPMADADGNKVEACWQKAGKGYKAKNNLFDAEVTGLAVTITVRNDQPGGKKAGQKVAFRPRVFLDGAEQPAAENATMLAVDPLNGSYAENTLEWDCGICKRRLRLIEGMVLGYWLFERNPRGEVSIKYNQSGDLRLNLGRHSVSDDEERIAEKTFDEASYPLVVSDSLTVYSSALDGYTEISNVTYLTAHNAANATVVNSTATWIIVYNGWWQNAYWLERGYLYFNTDAIGSDNIVYAATLSLYGYYKEENNPHQADLGIVQGTFDAANDGLAAADYGAVLGCTTLGADSYYDYDEWITSDYNNKALNATGIGWINKTGITKFALRVKGDIDASTPTEDNLIYPWASEKGNNYKPKLVITYGPPVTEKTSSDSGVGTDAVAAGNPVVTIVKSDAGLGADAVSAGNPMAEMLCGDEGAGSDALGELLAEHFAAEEGEGVESSELLAELSAFDGGTGSERPVVIFVSEVEAKQVFPVIGGRHVIDSIGGDE